MPAKEEGPGTTKWSSTYNVLRYKISGRTEVPTQMATRSETDVPAGSSRELKRGALELIVLHLLAPGEAYGYEIAAKLSARTDGALEVSDGTLYPVLYRLERAQFVSVRWETPERGVPRKYYALTDAGQRELDRLAREWTTFADAMEKLLGAR